MTGSDILVRSLAEEGVEHVFGYPGGSVLYIYDAIYKQDKFKHILGPGMNRLPFMPPTLMQEVPEKSVLHWSLRDQESQMPLQVLQLLTWIPFRSY